MIDWLIDLVYGHPNKSKVTNKVPESTLTIGEVLDSSPFLDLPETATKLRGGKMTDTWVSIFGKFKGCDEFSSYQALIVLALVQKVMEQEQKINNLETTVRSVSWI